MNAFEVAELDNAFMRNFYKAGLSQDASLIVSVLRTSDKTGSIQ